jgi:hypothetical protein
VFLLAIQDGKMVLFVRVREERDLDLAGSPIPDPRQNSQPEERPYDLNERNWSLEVVHIREIYEFITLHHIIVRRTSPGSPQSPPAYAIRVSSARV